MSVTSTSAGEPTSLAGRDLALLIGMNLIWGLNLIASKIGVGQFPPIFFTALRFGSLALFLVPMLKVHRGQMVNLFAAAMLTGPATFALLFAGIFLAQDAATVAVASQMGVPFSTLMSVMFLGETIRWRRTLGIVLAFAGIVIISFDPRVFAYWEGLALVVCSSLRVLHRAARRVATVLARPCPADGLSDFTKDLSDIVAVNRLSRNAKCTRPDGEVLNRGGP